MITGIIDGLINGTWRVRDEPLEVSGSAITSFSFDVSSRASKRYKLICFFKGATATATNYSMTFNSDTAANYGYQTISGENTTGSALRQTAANNILLNGTTVSTGEYQLSIIDIKADQLQPKVVNVFTAGAVSSSIVEQVKKVGGVWNNNSDEITSIDITSSQASAIGINSFFVLLEEVETTGMQSGILQPNKISGGIELVDEYAVSGGAISGFSFTGLSGDTDKIYLINGLIKNANSGIMSLSARFNNNSAAVYSDQDLKGISAVVSATRTSTANQFQTITNSSALNDLGLFTSIIFALSGNDRLMITETSTGINSSGVESVRIFGRSWGNTADEITQINFFEVGSNAYIANDSKVELYRINDL